MKKIDRLIYDIHEYLKGNHGDPSGEPSPNTEAGVITLSKNVAYHTLDLTKGRPVEAKATTDKMIRMSELGEPCLRKLVYKRYHPHLGLPPHAESGPPTLQVKFLLGDYVEEVALFLAQEAGHMVTHRQDTVEYRPSGTDWYSVGHLDAIIDGHVIDVKSASDFAFNKYKREGMTAENDGFGYRYQIDGYATALKMTGRGFLFVNKHDGEMLLVDRSNEPVIDIAQRIRDIGTHLDEYLDMGKAPERLPLSYDKKSDQQKLGTVCSYCAFKHHCYSDSPKRLEGYIVSGKPVYFVDLDMKGRDYVEGRQKIPTP